MSILIDAGVDVNESDGLGNSAGHLAVLARCVENLKFLLAHGAQVDKQNDAGETMLFMAAAARLVNIVDLLIDAGADLNVRNNKSVSPLFDSLASNVEIARHLLRAGASHNDIGENGCSACHVPARSGRVESLRLLLEFGANVHAVNNDGASVAHGAQGWAIPLLHSLGVNLNGVDDLGNTPCHAARDEAALVALFALGVTMTAMNNHGATPYDKFLAKKYSEEVLTFVAAGIGFGVQTQLQHGNICAIVMAGGGLVSAETDVADLRAQEGHALKRIFDRQRQLFRWRALEVCLGLQSLHVSAMEMYEILAHMFAPLECVVPFGFAWRIVCAVKHKKKE
jgi:ankyrin repeat protein